MLSLYTSVALVYAHARHLGQLPCGFGRDCPLDYSLADINASARLWGSRQHQVSEAEACGTAARSTVGSTSVGAYCLPPMDTTPCRKNPILPPSKGRRCTALVRLDGNQSYKIPSGHVPADAYVVETLVALMQRRPAPKSRLVTSAADALKATSSTERLSLDSADGVAQPLASARHSVLDLGAGVGQIGHSLLARRRYDGDFAYRGCDGAANIGTATGGFLSYCDLARPLSLPRAHWVLSMETGEHIPHSLESTYVRNLHAHNCVGIIVSWAALRQPGHMHINNHDASYVIHVFEQLGYFVDEQLTSWLRSGGAPAVQDAHAWVDEHGLVHSQRWVAPWLRNTLLGLRRRQPIEPCISDG